MRNQPFVTVIMAAGKGKRMLNPEFPKVMFEVQGMPMVDHVVELALAVQSSRTIVIVGFKREIVTSHLTGKYGDKILIAVQSEQLGTGHAVMQTEELLQDYEGDVVVLSGDVPLLKQHTLENLLDTHHRSAAAMTVLTAQVEDPSGYGRIIRRDDGSVDRIVEDKDANPAEKRVNEINSGIYAFGKRPLFEALKHIKPDNSQHEYYLTDVFGYFVRNGMRVSAILADHFDEIRGVNTVVQLKEAEEVLELRKKSGRSG